MELAFLEGVASRMKAALRDASSLFDFHFSVGGLVLVNEQHLEVDVILHNAQGTFQSIKALSQRDGRWWYGPNNPESSSYAAGVTLETLAGVIKLADSEVNPPMIGPLISTGTSPGRSLPGL